MKIVINNIAYTKIKNLVFDTTADVTCQELPINEYSLDIITDDNISYGQYAYLYNNDDTLWAKYWIVDTTRHSDIALTIYCQSDLILLKRKTLEARMYTNANPVTLIQAIFADSGLNVDIDNAISSSPITGFAPKQTARERLQWLCFVAGAYIQTDFTDRTKIISVTSNLPKIALNDIVYYRPQIQYNDWTTAIKLHAYNYFEGVPGRTDEYVQEVISGVTHTYVQSEQVITLTNPDAPATAPENVIEIGGITLIDYGSGSTTADNILNRLARYYFKRAEVTAEIIDNGEFQAGNQIILDEGTGEIIVGYIKQTDFSFGHNHKANITISSADVAQGVELDIVAKHDNEEIGRNVYFLPSGYIYSIDNEYILTYGFETQGDRNSYKKTLYRPQNTAANGTVGNDITTNTQEYDVAIEQAFGKARLYIVDNVNESSGKVVIA